MRQLPIVFALLLSGVLSAQTEHWKFETTITEVEPVFTEIYTASGKYQINGSTGDVTSRVVGDSVASKVLSMVSDEYGNHYRYDMVRHSRTTGSGENGDASDLSSVDYEPEQFMDFEAMGVEYKVTSETKQLLGYTAVKVTLESEDVTGSGWAISGVKIPIFPVVRLSNGREAVLVEGDIQEGATEVSWKLTFHERLAATPKGVFSLAAPEGYTLETDE